MAKQTASFPKDFILLSAGQVISLFGNQILRFALPLYLLSQTGSSALFGAVSAVSFLPMILLFPIGGVLADRLNKRDIMAALDFAAGALTLAFSLSVSGQNILPLTASLMLFLCAAQGVYQPAVQASIPALVNGGQMMAANSIADIICSLANMLGPVLGGLLFAWAGLSPILYVSGACFLLSAFMELFIRIPFQKKRAGEGIFTSGLRDIGESLHFLLRRQPDLLKAALAFGAVSLLLCALFTIALPVLFTQQLGFSEGAANKLYGYSQGAIAAGSMGDGALAGIFSQRLRARHIPYNIAGYALCIFLQGIALRALHDPTAVFLMLTLGCSVPMALSALFQIQLLSYIQLLTPPDMIGKVVSCVICICMCSTPAGRLFYGLVFEHIGGRAYLPFCLAGLAALFLEFRSRRLFAEMDARLGQGLKGAEKESRGVSAY